MSVTKDGHTKIRHLRVPDAVWAEAAENAASEGSSISEVVRHLLRTYNEQSRARRHEPAGADPVAREG